MDEPVSQRHPIPSLDDCATEPIHVPGAIQPHGALLAFDETGLSAWSCNAAAVLGGTFRLGAALPSLDLPEGLLARLEEDIADADAMPGLASSAPVVIGEVAFTRMVHRHDGRLIVEFERSAPGSHVLDLGSRLLAELRNENQAGRILARCADRIRAWTGFDRVMAYVFQHDGSGEVVAESVAEGVDSFLGMRFPATDIPAQARRLYVLNTLRFIPDVNYTPDDLLGRSGERPIDLSFATLRSVSPIHVEYLNNMGVGASMSVSIVVEGELWGLFACHHLGALHVHQAARQACDTLAHFVSTRIQAIESAAEAAHQQRASEVIPTLAGSLLSADGVLAGLSEHEAAIRELLNADALILQFQSHVRQFGGIPRELALSMLSALDAVDADWIALGAADAWPGDMTDRLDGWVGALDICFDRPSGGRIVAVRREQISTVRWGGQPEKVWKAGPLGPRLTPRGSFAEWRETVRGRSKPWRGVTERIGKRLQLELTRVSMARHNEMQEARHHLLAMLGHDLRNPLHAIQMAASFLKRDDASRAWGTRIDSSSGRMQRLIAQVLDFSRAEAGLPLTGETRDFDLAGMLRDLVDESRVVHPDSDYQLVADGPVQWHGDPERVAQAVSNLLSNARHHGRPGTSIDVVLRRLAAGTMIEVRNYAAPIPESVAANLFVPYKPRGISLTNRSGLGLGLYIASRIALACDGDLTYRYDGGQVVFALRLGERHGG